MSKIFLEPHANGDYPLELDLSKAYRIKVRPWTPQGRRPYDASASTCRTCGSTTTSRRAASSAGTSDATGKPAQEEPTTRRAARSSSRRCRRRKRAVPESTRTSSASTKPWLIVLRRRINDPEHRLALQLQPNLVGFSNAHLTTGKREHGLLRQLESDLIIHAKFMHGKRRR